MTYAPPRKDVKPIAHALLDRFGALSNVLDAKTADLASVVEIGESAARMLPTQEDETTTRQGKLF